MAASVNLGLFLTACFIASSFQAKPDEAKVTLEGFWKDAEKRLVETQPATLSILDQPLAKLKDLRDAGKQSIDDIVAFEGPGDPDQAIESSLQFWKDKMEDVIKPFLDNAETNKLLVIDIAPELPEPNFEKTEEYLKHEEEINKTVEEAEASLKKEYDRITAKPPATVEEVPKHAWKKVAAKWPVDNTVNVIRSSGKYAKHDAGQGNHETGLEKLRNDIKNWSEITLQDLKKVEEA